MPGLDDGLCRGQQLSIVVPGHGSGTLLVAGGMFLLEVLEDIDVGQVVPLLIL